MEESRIGSSRRLTLPNPNGKGYRVCVDQEGTLEIKDQGRCGRFAYGSFVNYTAQLEEELMRIKNDGTTGECGTV